MELKISTFKLVTSFCIAFLCCAVIAKGQNWDEIIKLNSDPKKNSAQFGYSVAMSGNYAVVGANTESRPIPGKVFNQVAGAVYVLYNNGGNWSVIKQIPFPEDDNYSYFGQSVSIDGEYIVVGTPDDNVSVSGTVLNKCGSAFLFKKDQGGTNNWELIKKITASDAAGSAQFGSSVSISNNNIVIGASSANGYKGSAYVFSKEDMTPENWVESKKLTTSIPISDYGQFGSSVSINNNFIIIGTGNARSAYIYEKSYGGQNNWGELKRIAPPDPYEGGNFGFCVSISGDYAVVGDYMASEIDPISESGFNNYPGYAYIYKKDSGGNNNWGEIKRLKSTNVQAWYGYSLNIKGDYLIVGEPRYHFRLSPGNSNNIYDSGAAYIYKKDLGGPDNWGEMKKILPGDSITGNRFGSAVCVDEAYALSGAPLDRDIPETTWDPNHLAGSVYVFKQQFCNDVSEMTIPVAEGIYQSTSVIKQGNLTHYCDCENNYLLLTLDETGSEAVIPNKGVKLKIGAGADFYPGGTGFITNPDGVAMFNRQWSVVPFIQPKSDVKVRSYYSTTDFNAVNTTLVTNGKPVIVKDDQMFFYKVTDPLLGEFPAIADIPGNKVKVITHGSAASTSKWVKGNAGPDYAEFLVSSFSGGGGGGTFSGNPLPVTLISFEAEKKENNALLHWSTSFESSSQYFEIQKSIKGQFWEALGLVQAAGESNDVKNYSFLVKNPSEGENLFRLKMVDIDGTFAYSRIRNLSYENTGISVYPNPASDKLYIKALDFNTLKSITIFNMLGGIVYHSEKIGNDGIPTNHIESGMYTVQIKKPDGSVQNSKVSIIK